MGVRACPFVNGQIFGVRAFAKKFERSRLAELGVGAYANGRAQSFPAAFPGMLELLW